MKKKIMVFMVIMSLAAPSRTQAFDFGATAALVAKLIAQHVQELARLQQIIRQGNDAYRLATDVYRGVNNTLRILRSLEENLDPGTFRELKLDLDRIIGKIERLYGRIPDTPRKEALMLHDQTIIDTISRHNQIYEDHEQMTEDRRWLEDEIRSIPSPGRSAQLSVGIEYEILKALARIEKNQAQSLKILALHLGMKNELEKKRAEETMEQYESLSEAFETFDFKSPLPSVR